MKPSIHWLFIFIPITVALGLVGRLPPPLIFFSAALAVVPIAALIAQSAEQLSKHTGDAIGGLLTATFGNAEALIIGIVALSSGYLEMVRASLIGSILVDLLLATGLSFFLGGLRYHEQKYNPLAARTYTSMMVIAVISLIVPSAFSRILAPEGTIPQERSLNLGIAGVLLLAYGLYLLFSLKTHRGTFTSGESDDDADNDRPWSLARAAGSLIGASVLAAWMCTVLVGAAEGTGKSLGMTQVFIGMVFLAAVGSVSETGSAIVMARKNKMDLSVGIALGSSIQIALFVAPVLVLLSYFIGPEPLKLSFNRAETGSLFMAVLIAAVVCGDGQSNWYKGVQLMTVYTMIALMFYFIPATGQ